MSDAPQANSAGRPAPATAEPFIPYGALDNVGAAAGAHILERSGGSLMNVTRMMLNCPTLVSEWLAFVINLKTLSLDPLIREIAICTVTGINGASYAFEHHIPPLLAAGGTQKQVDALKSINDDLINDRSIFNDAEAVVVRFARYCTLYVRVPDELRQETLDRLGDNRKYVELAMVVSFYNAMSRFLLATGVGTNGEG